MVYMATSLAFCAGGLFICYELWKVVPAEGQTLNTILAEAVFKGWTGGPWLILITILSEGALLLVAAQTGFLDGPRVTGQHGGGLLAAASLRSPIRAAHHAQTGWS